MAAWSDREAELWGSLGTQGTLAAPRRMSPFSTPNTNPRVSGVGFRSDSWKWCKKIGSGTTTIGLGVGMSDLGEPGFSEEIALSGRA